MHTHVYIFIHTHKYVIPGSVHEPQRSTQEQTLRQLHWVSGLGLGPHHPISEAAEGEPQLSTQALQKRRAREVVLAWQVSSCMTNMAHRWVL